MSRIALGLSYDGAAWHGWQSQPHRRTIQDALEDALSRFADRPVRVACAGRTDTGVHALGQVVHFDCDARRTPQGWVRGVNALLPASIAVTWSVAFGGPDDGPEAVRGPTGPAGASDAGGSGRFVGHGAGARSDAASGARAGSSGASAHAGSGLPDAATGAPGAVTSSAHDSRSTAPAATSASAPTGAVAPVPAGAPTGGGADALTGPAATATGVDATAARRGGASDESPDARTIAVGSPRAARSAIEPVDGPPPERPDPQRVEPSGARSGALFDARFDAMARTYHYLLLIQPQRSPQWTGRAGWTHTPLDIEAMRTACAALVGTHDFSAFRSAECQAKSPVKTLSLATVETSGSFVRFTFRANAFLHHMVRNLVGTLVAIGRGREPPEWVTALIAGRDRTVAAPTFMPDGLYLARVDYPASIALPPPVAFAQVHAGFAESAR